MFAPHRIISFVFRIYSFTFISWLSRPPETEFNSCPHSVRYAETVPLKLYTGRQICAYQKAETITCICSRSSFHTHTLDLNLDCPFFVFSLCFRVPLGLRPKKARERNYILKYTESQKLQFTFYKNNSSPWENICTNNNNYYMTDMDMGNEIFSCFWLVRPFY